MRAFIAFVLAALASAMANGQELVSVPSRPGVTQSYLLEAPSGEAVQGSAILFPGGEGAIRLRNEGGRIKFGPNNFVVRTRGDFVRQGIVAAVIDAPSDQSSGMSDAFRSGTDHVRDIEAVIQDLNKRFPSVPVFLVGTSRGTVSAAYVGRALGSTVAGVVLTSSVYLQAGGARAGKPGLSGFDFASISTRLLLVHHRDDGCFATPYSEAQRLATRFPLISVKGGKPATSGPCEPMSEHGFFGKEPETVDAITKWMLGKPFPTKVD